MTQIWEHSTNTPDKTQLAVLTSLTDKLIALYREQGRLERNPLYSSRKRTLSLPTESIHKMLNQSTVLVTGGLGCVGSALVRSLLEYDPAKIVVVDKVTSEQSMYELPASSRITLKQHDILDEKGLEDLFREYQPAYVFHTAAQRNPGLAEKTILDTIKTNVLGTLAVLNACEKAPSVKQCVFSSTGKASRYLTNEIYAATKKICEMMLDDFSKSSSKIYSMVRFTHIVDNSLMDEQIREYAEKEDFIPIHSPGKFVTAQNVNEAALLLLNALIHSEKGIARFLLVKNLEWPVESLELALYYIQEFKRKIPIIFTGNPKGYGEKFFRGQLDWKNPLELNLLINVYENRKRQVNEADDIIISSLVPTSRFLLHNLISDLKNVTTDQDAKTVLLSGLKNLFEDSLTHVPTSQTEEILKWGLDQNHLREDGLSPSDFGDMIPLMQRSLSNTGLEKEARKPFELPR
ncbi:polysaccharide biosynthesis protein [Cyclobacterium jeungdonense]|uniref:Polysaccharide biosynthesis protein n=1 Tax=Cyclobacterium jeungdonense TaxID=708087 RepID=A0ABT8C519_9BACT|nr:polysaccharide biosynthesis protein [Cyclobacterium jeungdonense]MDN3686713.1 polysaccharide biosynthesis protein [Cyclobacterium jeungdonense]